MATTWTRSLVPCVVVVLLAALAAQARADALAADRAASADGFSVTAAMRETAKADARRKAIEPAAGRRLHGDPEFGTEQFPRFDGTVDSPPVAEPRLSPWSVSATSGPDRPSVH